MIASQLQSARLAAALAGVASFSDCEDINTRNDMGIQNRDYMKRPDHDDGRGSSSDSRLEEFFSGFLQRHPRFFIYVGIGLAVSIVIAIVVAMLTTRSQ